MKHILLAGLVAGILLFGVSTISQDEVTGFGIFDVFEKAKVKQVTKEQRAYDIKRFKEKTKKEEELQSGDLPTIPIDFPIPCNAAGTEFCVNIETEGRQGFSAVDASDEKFVTIWQKLNQAVPSTKPAILARVFSTSTGQPLTGEITVATSEFHFSLGGPVTVLDDGGFMVSWDIREPGNPTETDVVAKVFDSSYAPVGGSFIVPQESSGFQSVFGVERLADGNILIVWMSDHEGPMMVYGRIFDQSGNPLTNEFTLLDDYGLGGDISASPKEGFIFTWYEVNAQQATSDVYAKQFDNFGNAIGSKFKVNTIGKSNAVPSVDYLRDGSFVVVWTYQYPDISGPGKDIYVRHYDSAASPLGVEFKANSISYPSGTGLSTPHVQAKLDQDQYVVAWQNYVFGFLSEGEIYARVFDFSDIPLASETMVNTYLPGNQYHKDIAAYRRGHVIVWTSGWSGHQDGDSAGVFGQRYDPNNNKI